MDEGTNMGRHGNVFNYHMRYWFIVGISVRNLIGAVDHTIIYKLIYINIERLIYFAQTELYFIVGY